MTSTTMYTVRANYRAWEQDFGILPMPKLTEDQPYVDVVSTATCGSLYSIPKSNKELDLTGYALEAFCRESKDTLRVAYYDLTITHKTMRDPESAEMMDIILANRYFDMAIIYNWGGWYQYFYNLWGTSGSNFASTYESAKDKTIAEINTTVDEFLKSN
ncbi:hypothetical protein SDC9_121505 [bioreactor metagenome]|uniref:Uncharacterized protein n=1 Tax=bioreactor metagenome TaxID=1076179 RepID=A0A645CC51_9ZZZZ